MRRTRYTPAERVLRKIKVHPLGCWEFTGHLNFRGYGIVSVDGLPRKVHRVVYEEEVGAIPPEWTIDHLCMNKRCVFPGHLEAVTRAENQRRGQAAGHVRKPGTHCRNGHEFTPENTITDAKRGHRKCRTCRQEYARVYARERYHRMKEAR